MDIILSSNDSYAPYLTTAMLSVLNNANHEDKIHFHIIADNISKDNQDKIYSLQAIKSCGITFYAPPPRQIINKYLSILSKMKIQWFKDPSIFYRLNAHEILPNTIDKALYLDCDMIVRKSLKEVFDMDMGEDLAIVADDAAITNRAANYKLGEQNWKEFLESIGLDLKTHYFCSGFLMINLKKWREIGITKLFDTYLFKYNPHIIYPDQDALNYVLRDKVKYIDNDWSFIPIKSAYASPPPLEPICILHFAATKPLNPECADKFYLEEFWKYFCQTPYFKDNPTKYIDIQLQQRLSEFISDLRAKHNGLTRAIARFIPITKLRHNFRKKYFI